MRAFRRCRLATLLLCTPALAGAQGAPPPAASFDSAWAAIARTYWDTAFVAGPWRAVRDSLRAALPGDADDDAVRIAIRALIAVPRQSHFLLLPGSAVPAGQSRATGAPGTTGLEVRPLDGGVVASRVEPASVGARAGVRPGDRIVHVDAVALDSLQRVMRAAATDTAAADRLLAAWVTSRLAGAEGDSVRLQVIDAAGRRRALHLARGPFDGEITQFGNLPPFPVRAEGHRLALGGAPAREAALIRFNGWFPALSAALDSLFFGSRDAAGLILDLRGNPGGVIGMLSGVSGHMLDTARSLGELRTRSGVLRFTANPRRVDRRGTRTEPYAGPVAILVDEFSGSTTEFFAAGMQAIGRARVFGTTSAGQALPAAVGRLPSGDVLIHVIADHADPLGRRVEGVGVQPDVRVPLSPAALRAGRDAALEAARDWIARGGR